MGLRSFQHIEYSIGGTHPNVRHSVYSILPVLMGAARLMKLRLGVLTGVVGQRGRLALLSTRTPQEPKCLREGNYIYMKNKFMNLWGKYIKNTPCLLSEGFCATQHLFCVILQYLCCKFTVWRQTEVIFPDTDFHVTFYFAETKRETTRGRRVPWLQVSLCFTHWSNTRK